MEEVMLNSDEISLLNTDTWEVVSLSDGIIQFYKSFYEWRSKSFRIGLVFSDEFYTILKNITGFGYARYFRDISDEFDITQVLRRHNIYVEEFTVFCIEEINNFTGEIEIVNTEHTEYFAKRKLSEYRTSNSDRTFSYRISKKNKVFVNISED